MSGYTFSIVQQERLEYRRHVGRLIDRLVQVILAYLVLKSNEQMQLGLE